jgi:N6-adenosine-specific RNA methylase IME4
VSWEGLTPPYATIVADPPWAYRTRAVITTAKTYLPSAIDRYSTLTTDALAALPVESLAAENAHLYLWTTNPKLPDAFAVVAAWGFEYVTTLTWRKLGTLGMGYYFRGDTEHVLFGIRGQLPIAPEKRERNWFEAAKTGHSQKPQAFLDLVERVSPEPRIELFARAPRLGWDSWGYGYESERAS